MEGISRDWAIEKLQWLLENPEVTWSGSGVYALSLIVGAVVAVAVYVLRSKKKNPASSTFTSNSGEQNNAQGKNPIGKQENYYGVPPETFAKYVEELGVTKAALASFFKILQEPQVLPGDLDSKLREFACQYKEFKLRLQVISSDDPEVKALKKQAEQAFDNGRFPEVEELLDQIDERHDNAIHQLHKLQAETSARLEKEQLGKAENLVSRAKLQRLQYNYKKSAQYFQEAATALPEGHEVERAEYLGAAGYDLGRIAPYAEVLSLYEQSLSIFRAIGDRKREAKLLNNISQIYHDQSDYGKAVQYLEQSLLILQEVGDEKGQGVNLNNVAGIYWSKGDYTKALQYLEQTLLLAREIRDWEGEGCTLNNIGEIHRQQGDSTSALEYYKKALAIAREINNKHGESTCLNNIGQVYHDQENYDAALKQYNESLAIKQQIGDCQGEGTTLNNIASIYYAKGDYPAALKQYEQTLGITEEIGDKAQEAITDMNIGWLYTKQGNLAEAEPYLSRAVELAEQLEHPKQEEWRKVLEEVRAKLRAQRNQ